MQIKPSKVKSTSNDKIAILKDGRKIVMEIDTKDLLKDKGANYYALFTGANAYFFDNPIDTIHNCVLVKCGKNYYILTIPMLILDLIFWSANEMYSYAKEHLNKNTFNNITEHVTKMLVDSQQKVTPEISRCLADIKNNLSRFSQNFSSVKCNTLSIWSILQFKNRNKEFNTLFNTTLDPSKTIKETEIIVKDCEKRLTKVIAEDDLNCFKPYVMSELVATATYVKGNLKTGRSGAGCCVFDLINSNSVFSFFEDYIVIFIVLFGVIFPIYHI